jgi:hypothetical protein
MPVPAYNPTAPIPNSDRSRQLPTVGEAFRPMGHVARPVEQAQGGSKVLPLVLVAAISMVIVILTGLLVILGSD